MYSSKFVCNFFKFSRHAVIYFLDSSILRSRANFQNCRMRCLDHRLKKLHRNFSRPRNFRWWGFCNRKDARSRPFFRGLKRSVERQTYSPLENFQVARKETGEGGGTNARGWVGWPLWCNRNYSPVGVRSGTASDNTPWLDANINRQRQRRHSARNYM